MVEGCEDQGTLGLGRRPPDLPYPPGVKEKLDYVAALGVQGLVLGPLHDTKRDSPKDTNLQKLHPQLGSNETLAQLLEAAKKKGKVGGGVQA